MTPQYWRSLQRNPLRFCAQMALSDIRRVACAFQQGGDPRAALRVIEAIADAFHNTAISPYSALELELALDKIDSSGIRTDWLMSVIYARKLLRKENEREASATADKQ